MSLSARPRGRFVLLSVGAAVFVATFLFRFLTLDFMNDHFVHLTRGRQILLGEVPVRDFFDPGLFLQYYASTAALVLSGGTLFGEAILTVSLIALGGALTFLLAATLSASLPLGLIAAIAAMSIEPRLYGYPKVFLFVLALLCAWRYVHHRSTTWLLVTVTVTAVAFLFRHDHGVYIGISMAGIFALLDWGSMPRVATTFGRYLAFTALLLLPFGIFIQSTAGVATYLRGSAPQMSELATPQFVWPPFSFVGSPPADVSGNPVAQRVHVRWSQDVDEAVRGEREQRYGLTNAARSDDPQTWSYVLTNDSHENIRALVADPLVADTNGIDRNAASVPSETARETAARRLLAVRSAVLTEGNALAWLYYSTLLLPFAGALALLMAWRGGQIAREKMAVVGGLVLLCAVIEVTLVRGSPGNRLPDVAAPMAVLGAWVTARWLKGRNSSATSRSMGRFIAASLVWLVTLWSCATLGNAGLLREAAGVLANPGSTLTRLRATTQTLRMRPIDAWAPPGSTGERALARYLYQCTTPTDRVLTANFLPELNFYSERGFAGGQVYLLVGWHASTRDQELTLARIERQRVPVMIVDEATQELTWRNFPLVADHVRRRYRVAATSAFGGDRVYVVYVDRDLQPAGAYEPLGLPCYR